MSLASRAVALLQKQYEVVFRRMRQCQWSEEYGTLVSMLKASVQGFFCARHIAAVAPMEALEPRTLMSAVLVKDISLAGSDMWTSPAAVNSDLYFINRDANYGFQLWKTDGTETGTARIKNLGIYPTGFGPLNLTNIDGELFFTTSDGTGGSKLWKSDGTDAGTVQVKDILAATSSFSPTNLTNINGVLYFTAADVAGGSELWKSDGTDVGTVRVKDIYVGTGSSSPSNLTNVNGILYFTATDSTGGTELWKSDGTDTGTIRVKDIYIGTGSSSPSNLTNVNGILYFTATDSTGGTELWKSDGTETGTVRVKDIYAGTGSSSPSNLTNVNGTLYFAATDSTGGTELWKSDGTGTGTVRIKDIYTGTGSSSPSNFTNVNGTLYFIATDNTGHALLWKSDGTEVGTVLVKDLYYSRSNGFQPAHFTSVNNTLYFTNTDSATGNELWKSDGTESGTVRVADLNIGTYSSYPSKLIQLGDVLYVTAIGSTGGYELWKSDGTDTGTEHLLNLNIGTGSASPSKVTGDNGLAFFAATNNINGIELWKSDGTNGGTVLVKDINPGQANSGPSNLVSINDILYFTAVDSTSGRELWKSDGTEAGTVRVKDLYLGSTGSNPSNLTNVNGTLYFTATDNTGDTELWKSDGTADGTVCVKDIYAGTNSSNPSNLTNVKGTLYFTATDSTGGNELWKSDGTNAGTIRIKDINPGVVNSSPSALTNVNGTLYFTADNGTDGRELWKSDGTEAGTVRVKDIYLGATGSNPSNLTNVNGILYFTATDSEGGSELWKSDGTETGTIRVKDIYPGTIGASPSNLTNANGILYFTAWESTDGTELWKSNGTEAGTVCVKDIYVGTGSSNPSSLTNVNGILYFAATDSTGDNELWKSDGSNAGTFEVKDIRIGVIGSSPSNLTSIDGDLYFTAMDDFHGKELWMVRSPEANIASVSVPEGDSVTLDASGSGDPDPNETLTYAWDLDGDGVYGETGSDASRGDEIGVNPTFSAAGLDGNSTYNISLRVTDSAGLTSQADQTISITDVAPTLALSGATSIQRGSLYTLSLSASDPGPDTISSWNINWGDGSDPDGDGSVGEIIQGNPSSVTHTYASGGQAYTITATATNEDGTYSVAPMNVRVTTGTIQEEVWTNIIGGNVSDLTANSNYPNNANLVNQLSQFKIPTNWGDLYGARIRGYITAPTTGDYTFWIASDDGSELYLSMDESVANKQLIASNGYTGIEEWDINPSQRSSVIHLNAGQRYYIDALYKESGGTDYLAVAWQGPGFERQIIAGKYLDPYVATTAPIAPTNVTVAIQNNQDIACVTWQDNSDSETGYVIERATDGQNFVVVGTTVTSATSFIDSNLDPATTYTYRIRALNAVGSSCSSVITATTSALLIPGFGVIQQGTTCALKLMNELPDKYMIRSWNINWGDGSDPDGDGSVGEIIQGNPSSVTHTYASGGQAYTITATATNEDGTYSVAPMNVRVTTGTIQEEVWTNIIGGNVSDLTANSNYPNNANLVNQLSQFKIPTNWGDLYGARIRGYITAPTTGDYTFWIASDDGSELYLSMDESVANKQLIASNGYTGIEEWDINPSQRSSVIHLNAGQRYYIDALYKESGGTDYLAVAWQGPGFERQIVAGKYLDPYVTPTLTVSGAASTDEGGIYSLTLGPVQTSGTNTVSQYLINWGDNQISTVNASELPANRQLTHIYADGSTSGTAHTIQVSFVDENGTHANAASLNLTVQDVATTLGISGVIGIQQGSLYTLNLSSSDPGQDTIRSWNINWGDGSDPDNDGIVGEIVQGNPSSVTHTYASGGHAYSITATATNEDGTFAALSVNVRVTTGTIQREVWTNISGTDLSGLTSNASYPNMPNITDQLTRFETPSNWADNYGTRVRGYITAPATGDYTFWIASDDYSQLYLSTDESPANKQLIANLSGAVGSEQWDSNASQKSVTIHLVAGQRYYIEALQKESSGGDHLAVAWAGPGFTRQVIAGKYLDPFVAMAAPAMPSNLAVASWNTGVKLTWTDQSDVETGYIIQRSTDGVNFTTVATTAANVTSYQDFGLTSQTQYYYRIMATSVVASSLPTDTVSTVTTVGVSWTGSYSNNWNDGRNWSSGIVPDANTDVMINLSGTHTIYITDSRTVRNLTILGGNALALTGGSLQINQTADVHGNLNLSGGTLYLSGTLVTRGTTTWSGTNISNNGTWTNTGILNTAGSSLSTSNVVFNNNGTLEVTSGQLWINNGGSGAGSFIADNGTSLYFNSGTYTLGDGATLTGNGSGYVRLSGGILSVTGNVQASNFSFQGGNLTGTGTLTLFGSNNTWSNGTIVGHLAVASDSTLSLSNSSHLYLSGGTLTNNGTVNWVNTGGGYNIRLSNGASIDNYGTFDIQVDGTITADSSNDNSTLSFNNYGLVKKSAGSGAASFNSNGSVWVKFCNFRDVGNDQGVIIAQSGSLSLNSGGHGNGQYKAQGGDLYFGADYTFDDGAAILGTGSNLVYLSGGTLTIAGNVSGSGISIQGSTIAGAGTLTLDQINNSWRSGTISGNLTLLSTATLSINNSSHTYLNGGVLNNQGTINWINTGGGYNIRLSNGATINNYGTFDFEVDGTITTDYSSDTSALSFNNYGLLIRTTGTGTANFSNNGSSLLTLDNKSSGIVKSASGNLSLNCFGTGSGAFIADGGTLAFSSGSYTFQQGASFTGVGLSVVTLDGGEFTTTSTVAIHGNVRWYNSYIRGILNVADDGILSIVNGSHLYLNGGVLNNYGTVNWNNTNGGYNIRLSNGATINNYGIFDFKVDGTIVVDSSNDNSVLSFNNYGLVKKSAGTGNAYFANNSSAVVKFINVRGSKSDDGVILVQSGAFYLNSNGHGDGQYQAQGGDLYFGANYTLDDGATVTGNGNSVVRLSDGTLNIAGNVSGSGISIQGSTIAGTGTLTLDQTNNAWSSGTISGNLTLLSTASLSINNSNHAYLNGGVLNNNGTVTWANTGGGYNIRLSNGAMIKNYGTFDFKVDGIITADSSNDTSTLSFNNYGLMTKTAGTGSAYFNTNSSVRVVLNNNGTVDVRSGALYLNTGGTGGGTFKSNGGTLYFDGATYTLNNGAQLIGVGTSDYVRVSTNATLALAGSVTGSQFSLEGGQLNNAGGSLTLDGQNIWSSGIVATTLNVKATTGMLNITNGATIYLRAGTLNNSGTVVWSGNSEFQLSNGSTINNLADAIFDIRGNSNIKAESSTDTSTLSFNNVGTLRRSGSTGSASFATNGSAQILVNNNIGGVIEVVLGSLYLNSGGSGAGLFKSNGGTLYFGGLTYTLNASAELRGENSSYVRLSGGTLNVVADVTATRFILENSGTLCGTGSLTLQGQNNWNGGTLSTSLNIAAGATLAIANNTYTYLNAGALNNSGNVIWTGSYDIQFSNGGAIHNYATFDIQSNTSSLTARNSTDISSLVFSNAGLLKRSVGTGTTIFNVNGSAGVSLVNTGLVFSTTGTLALRGGVINHGVIKAIGTGGVEIQGVRLSGGVAGVTSSTITTNIAGLGVPANGQYDVQLSTDGINYASIGTIPLTQISYTAQGLLANTSYYLRFVSVDADGWQQIYETGLVTTALAPHLSGADTAVEGANYILNLSGAGNFVSHWIINWGDGSDPDGDGAIGQVVQGNPATVTHVFSAGNISRTITATAVTASGTFAANTLNVLANVPAAPTNLAATTVSDTQINLIWQDNSSVEQGYVIEASTDGTTFNSIDTIGANVTHYLVNGLTAGATYIFRVKAINAGASGYTNTATAITASEPDTTVTLGAPSDLAAAVISNNQVRLTWTDNASNEAGYVLEQSTNGVDFTMVIQADANATGAILTGLTAGTSYWFRVHATAAGNDSDPTNIATVTTTANLPATPADLAATAASTTQVNLTWTNLASQDGYYIERSTDGTNFTQIGTVDANASSYAVSGLSANTTYYFRIRAYNTAGNSNYSNSVQVLTTLAPNAPSNLIASTSVAYPTQVTLTWTDNANNEQGLVIERSTDGVAFQAINTVSANITNYTDYSLSTNARYFYRIRAYNAGGLSAYTATAQVVMPLATPTGLSATAVSSSQINLAWTAVAGATGYRIYRSADGSNWSTTPIATTTTNAFSDATLSEGQYAYYCIVAFNPWNNSIPSSYTSCAAQPNAPTNLSVVAISGGQVTLSWQDNSNKESGFYAYYSQTGADNTWYFMNPSSVTGGVAGSAITSTFTSTFTPGTTYYFKVIAYGNSTSGPATASITTAAWPIAPSNLSATAVSDVQINLTWTDYAANETGYKIERSNDGATWTLIDTVAAGAHSYSDAGLSEGIRYYYRVKAINAAGESAPATSLYVYTQPKAPTNLSVVAISNSQVTLSWQDNSGNESSYYVYYSLTGSDNSWSYFGSVTGGTTGSTVTRNLNQSFASNTTYYFKIVATGNSTSTPSTTTVTTATWPATPTNLTATALSDSQIQLAWTDNANGESGYTVERSSDGSSWTVIQTLDPNCQTYTDANLAESTYYYYRIKAISGIYQSAALTSSYIYTLPKTPSNLAVTAISSTQVALSWQDNSSKESYYYAYYSPTGADNSWTYLGYAYGSAVGSTVAPGPYSGSFAAGTTYYFKVVAIGNGTSLPATTNITTPAWMAAPTNLITTAVSDSRIDLAWTDNASNESGYKIERSLDGSNWTTIDTVGANVNAYSDTGLTEYTRYYYRVKATNSSGDSAPTATSSAYTQPAAPTNLSVASITAGQVILSWQDNSNKESSFSAYYSLTGTSGWVSLGNWSSSTLPVGSSVTGTFNVSLMPSTTYYFKVVANGNGSSAAATATGTSSADWPSPPSNLTAMVVSDSQINLTWVDNATAETGYTVERSTNGSTWTVVATLDVNVASYSDVGLAEGTSYYYRVKAFDSVSESGPIKTSAIYTQPTAPTNLVVTSISSSQVALSWQDNSNKESYFYAYYSPTGADNTWTYLGYAYGGAAGSTVTPGAFGGSFAAGATYYFKVVAIGNGTSSPLMTSLVTPWPVAPTAFTAAAVSDSQVHLSWTDNANNETGYKIERSTDGSNWNLIYTTGMNASSYDDSGLVESTRYFYRIKATNASGDSTAVTVSNVYTTPKAPTNLAVRGISSSQVTLSWQDNSNTESNFAAYYSLTGTDSWVSLGTVSSSSLPIGSTVTGTFSASFASGTTYYFKIVANGTSTSIPAATAVATAVWPSAPTNLTATAVSDSQINLTWADNASNETGYKIERSTDNYNWTTVQTLGANTTSYSDTGLAEGTYYYYRVKALNGLSESSAVSTSLYTSPKAPSGLTVVSISASQVTLSWQDNSNTEFYGFTAYYSLTGTGGWNSLGSVSTSSYPVGSTVTSSFTRSFTANTTYYFKMVANGYSSQSSLPATTFIKMPAAPAAPVLTASLGSNNNSVQLAWTDNIGNASKYMIEYAINGGSFQTLLQVDGTARSYTLTGLAASGSYTFRISASNGVFVTTSSTVSLAVLSPTGSPTIDALLNDTGASASDHLTNAKVLALQGHAAAGSLVSILLGGYQAIGTTYADSNGQWTLNVDMGGHADGTYGFAAQSTDGNGNVSALSTMFMVTLDATPPAVTLNPVAPTNKAIVSLSGLATNSSSDANTLTLKIYAGNNTNVDPVQVLTISLAAGASSFTIPATLLEGTYTVIAEQADVAGNIGKSQAITLMVLTSRPVITGITTASVSGNYTAGTVIPIQVSFDRVIYVSGNPTLELNSGGAAVYASGSGTNTLTFNYVIGTSDATGLLDYVSSSSLQGGTLQDAAGNTPLLTLATPGQPGSLSAAKSISIGTLTTAITLDDTWYTNSGSVQFTFDFNVDVTGVDATDFAIAADGITNAQILGIIGSGSHYVVTVGTGQGDGTLSLSLLNDGSIVGANGSALNTGGESITSDAYAIDKTAPSAPSGLTASDVTTNGLVLTWAAPSDGDVVSFQIFRDGVQIATTDTIRFVDTNLAAGTMYSYTIKALDYAGNISDASDPLQVQTTASSSVVLTSPAAQTATEGSEQLFDLGILTDSGTTGPWTVTVNWGDGSEAATFQVTEAGALSATHQYDDNGSYQARVFVSNSAGSTTAKLLSIDVANVAPTGVLVVPATVTRGSDVVVYVDPATDPSITDNDAGLLYAFDIGDGNGYSDFDHASGVEFSADNTGTRLVKVKIMDKDGGISEYSQYVTITDPAITPVIEGEPQVVQGDHYALGLYASDALNGNITWDVNWGDGSAHSVYSGDYVVGDHVYQHANNSYTIQVKAITSYGVFDVDPKTISVQKAQPDVAVTASPFIDENGNITIQLNHDLPEDLKYSWAIDWGDGNNSSSQSSAFAHRYSNPNSSYTVTASLKDGDGVELGSRSVTVRNFNVSLSTGGSSASSLTFSWNEDSSMARYELQILKDNAVVRIVSLEPGTTTITVDGLAASTTYQARLRGIDSGGVGYLSSPVTGSTSSAGDQQAITYYRLTGTVTFRRGESALTHTGSFQATATDWIQTDSLESLIYANVTGSATWSGGADGYASFPSGRFNVSGGTIGLEDGWDYDYNDDYWDVGYEVITVTGVAVTVSGSDLTEPATGSAGSTVTFWRGSGFTDGDITVHYTVSGNASSGSDYSGLASGSVTIASGESSAAMDWSVLADQLAEGTEQVIVTITSASGAVDVPIDAKRSTAVATIHDRNLLPDLQIDSNNNGQIDPSDNMIEDDASKPGKQVYASDHDLDGNNIPDYAQGFTQPGDAANDAYKSQVAGLKFTPITLTIPDGVDISKVQIKFSYDASNPATMTRTGAGTTADPYVYTLPQTGSLRIWTLDGDKIRDARSLQSSDEGNFIASDGWIDASKLFKNGQRTVTLYVEAVKSDVGAKDIKVMMKTTGAADADAASDTVKLTVQKFTYTADEIKKALAADSFYGKWVGFVLDHAMAKNMIKIGSGTGYLRSNSLQIIIGNTATDLKQAKQWALDGLRAWAASMAPTGSGHTFDKAHILFLEIARQWATEGMDYGSTVKNKDDSAQSLGSTFDFLYFFSKDAGSGTTGYSDSIVPNYYSWVFCNRIYAREPMPIINLAIPCSKGMNPDYWEADAVGAPRPGRDALGRYPNEDQAHHFAAYFEFGGDTDHVASTDYTLKKALIHTGDYGTDPSKPATYRSASNPGDYYLGILACDLGTKYYSHPGYYGKQITDLLRLPYSDGWKAMGRSSGL